MKFDTSFIERVRMSVNIVDLVGGYVRLRKQGQNHSALCPFHQEKTPSFSVSESRQIFKCFGCGVGGDVFAFVQQIEHLTFPEAVTFLAERSGIPLPANPAESSGENVERMRLLEIMRLADEFYREQLPRSSDAQDYLARRKITSETISRFGLGFAPPGSQIRDHLSSHGFSLAELEKCGLVARGEGGSCYDKFRSRVTFPIQNLGGQTIAFGGRILGDGVPKYLNSPETPLYSKGRNLYGLLAAREAIRRAGFAILVEGYFDCVVPSQCGVANIVASLGTSLTEGQVHLLGRYTRKVIVNFDPDSAGVNAALRSIDMFLAQGFQVNVLRLPHGEDPDSFVLNHGVERYREFLKSSESFVDFLLEHFIRQQRDPRSPKGKQEIVDHVLPYITRLPNRIERAEYISKISSRLMLDERIVMTELRRQARSTRRRGDEPGDKSGEKPRTPPEPTLAERTLLAALISDAHREKVIRSLEPDLYLNLVCERIFDQIVQQKNQSSEFCIFTVRKALQDDDLDLFDRLSLQSAEVILSDEIIASSVEALQDLQCDRISRQIQEEITREERGGVPSPRLEELLRKKEEIQRRRRR
jgi:DNA primase